jgi:hypothetical protein
MALACIEERKFCTSRTKRYGTTGDTFTVTDRLGRSKIFVIEQVLELDLGFVARTLFAYEGVDSPFEFIKLWKKIHPFKKWDPTQKVFVHYFKEPQI